MRCCFAHGMAVEFLLGQRVELRPECTVRALARLGSNRGNRLGGTARDGVKRDSFPKYGARCLYPVSDAEIACITDPTSAKGTCGRSNGVQAESPRFQQDM